MYNNQRGVNCSQVKREIIVNSDKYNSDPNYQKEIDEQLIQHLKR